MRISGQCLTAVQVTIVHLEGGGERYSWIFCSRSVSAFFLHERTPSSARACSGANKSSYSATVSSLQHQRYINKRNEIRSNM